jgi:hypothetical protein
MQKLSWFDNVLLEIEIISRMRQIFQELNLGHSWSGFSFENLLLK